jgi:hypothetical protein
MSRKRASLNAIMTGGFITPLIFVLAGFKPTWAFQGMPEFIITITSGIGIIDIIDDLLKWIKTKREGIS